MINKPKIENLKPFKKGQSGNPKGRPKKLIGRVNDEMESQGYFEASKDEILSCYLRLINIPESKLKSLIKQKSQPMLIRVVGKAIMSAKGFDIIEKILDRGVGRASLSIDHTTKGESLNYQPIWGKIDPVLDDKKNNSSK